MIVHLHILALTPKGVQCVTPASTGEPLWLPRSGSNVVWSEPPEMGAKVTATIPQWLAQKHKQLTRVRGQYGLEFHQPIELDPEKSKGELPMAYDNEKTGALFKNRKKEKPAHPDYRGQCEIEGRKLWISAWLKKSEKSGETYMSLSFTEAEEQRQQPAKPQHQERDYSRDTDIPF